MVKNRADVQKAALFVANNCTSDQVSRTPTGGVVTLVTPEGNAVVNVNGAVAGLASYATYDVWMRDLTGYTGESSNSYLPLGYSDPGSLTTDALRAGSFHLGFKTDVLKDGPYNVQVAINSDDGSQTGAPCRPRSTASR